jgi:transitional endoplasmic reticulum ATPase
MPRTRKTSRFKGMLASRLISAKDVDDDDEDFDGEDVFFGEPSDGADFLLRVLRDILANAVDLEEIQVSVIAKLREMPYMIDWGSLTPKAREIAEIAEAYVGTREKPMPRPGRRSAGHFRGKLIGRLDLLLAETPASEKFETIRRNARILGEIFDLPPAEERMLAICGSLRGQGNLARHVDEILRKAKTEVRAVRAISGADAQSAAAIVDGKTIITRAGLISIDDDEEDFSDIYAIRGRVSGVIQKGNADRNAIMEGLLRPAPKSQLDAADVGHMAAKVEAAVRILAGSCRENAKGVNLLLHGPPGTGKTETARLICGLAGLKGYMIGEMEDGDVDLDREDRVADLRTAQSLLEGGVGSVCIFDEMEDLTTFDIGQGSKLFMNRLLEENATPVIWIANDLEAIPDVLIRRMTFAFEVPVPPAKVQKSILRDLADRMRIPLADEDIDAMQRLTQVVPAVARSALRAASLSGGGAEDARLAWRGLNEALKGGQILDAAKASQEMFRPEMSVADTDLVVLADRLAGRGACRVSFCFHGLPGTGKSAFARYMSDRMGVRTIEKRGSDILGSYVGETEKNIALAFEQAKDENAALIFDEIDSLLTSRSTHVRSWETSQVNELLKALEDHPAPVFGCTNLVDNLDQAALRRFLFRVRFKALTPEKARICFRHYLGLEPPAALDMAGDLVPADFGLVKARVEILGIADPEEMVRLLAEEAKSRSPGMKPMGFRSALDG